jgi:cation:H+ antiporter
MLIVALVFAALSAVMTMGTWVGVGFVVALATYIFIALRQERAVAQDHGAAYDKGLAAQEVDHAFVPAQKSNRSVAVPLLTAAAGLAIVVLGGHLLVQGAVSIARSFGVSETVIGLTIVAVGTSMPELVTSIMAAIRKEADVAFGNIVGSNIYNVLGIGGVTALIAPSRVPAEIVRFDNLVMIGVSILVVAFAYTGKQISRREGALLLAGYITYVAILWP